ncbi:MAG: glycosyltransferase family 4 protein [Ignisphaera sp.]
MNYIKSVSDIGVKIVGYTDYPTLSRMLKTKSLRLIALMLFPKTLYIRIGVGNYDGVVVLHEGFDSIYTGYFLGEYFKIPRIALLQLPPFYSSKKRLYNILKDWVLWRTLVADNLWVKIMLKSEAIVEFNVFHKLSFTRMNRLLRNYTTLIAVSKAIPYEMGGEWLDKIVSLDPGVSLDENDLSIINAVRSRVREKRNYIVFGGRPISGKGLVEALISFSLISKHYKDLKLVITGRIRNPFLHGLRRFCKRLGIEDKVIFTGFVPREKRFEIVARARLMLYPSHVDAFPYAVLESLHLGTPVVGYRIPALEIYYSRQPGVKLVEEGDLEALTIEAMNVLEKGVEAVEPPKIKSWREIMADEVAIIRKALRM